MTTGARALLRTLVDGGVTTCFTNPGTSEMHFVSALDDVTEMRAVLALFEGVATGAADGHARMTGRPSATLLHLGPGLGNGLANLHNARKARTPIVNIVGDHATYHTKYDAQLQSDIETAARNVSSWVRTSSSPAELGSDAAEAITAASGPPGEVATLILPADVSWSDGAEPASVAPDAGRGDGHPAEAIDAAVAALRRGRNAILLGGRALRGEELRTAARLALATNSKLFCEVFPARVERGAGVPAMERLAYLSEIASVQLGGFDNLILVDAKPPVSFFGYPGKASELVPESCNVIDLGYGLADVGAALDELAGEYAATGTTPVAQAVRPARPSGPLTSGKVCQAIGALLPENAIVSDEAQTSGVSLPLHTAGAPAHDLLALTGGAIGQGLPVAVGAAVACPDRPVIALDGEGSAMYTIQSLWTMAREQLDVTVVIFNNKSYAILNIELQRTGAHRKPGPRAKEQLDLADPDLDFVRLAEGMGVPAVRVDSGEAFSDAFARALAEPGPHLIEALVPSEFTGMRLKAMPHVLGAMTRLPHPLADALRRRIAP